MRRSHDSFLKQLYQAGIADAVRLFHEDLATHVKWATLEWVRTEIPILGEKPRKVITDLVGSAKDAEGRYLKVLVHPELQMQKHGAMGWRALEYNAGLTLQEGNPDVRVITLVFYHCPGVGGIRKERFELDFYGEPTLGVSYWVVGLGDLDAEAYAGSDNPMAWALASWMKKPRHGRVTLRLGLQEKILRLVQDEPYRWLLLNTVRTYFKLNQREQAEEQELLATRDYREVKNEMLTAFDKLRLEGHQV
ncbi:MAG: hypothetical protein M3Y56_03785, partial [Armatimonadota bacterium]|nr:hypothetical protein [Armatimonadota bacterium]